MQVVEIVSVPNDPTDCAKLEILPTSPIYVRSSNLEHYTFTGSQLGVERCMLWCRFRDWSAQEPAYLGFPLKGPSILQN